jgi:hypothetical protein
MKAITSMRERFRLGSRPPIQHLPKSLTKTGRSAVPTVVRLVVVMLCALVYGSQAGFGQRSATDKKSAAPSFQIPAHVAETRELILTAVRAAAIDDLVPLIDSSPTRTEFGLAGQHDGASAVAALKKRSADGNGHEILALLASVLDVAPATLPLGKDLENNLIYVWPYLAERPIESLSGPELVDLYRIVPAAKIAEMREKQRWLWWRVVIGADGSWLSFTRQE